MTHWALSLALGVVSDVPLSVSFLATCCLACVLKLTLASFVATFANRNKFFSVLSGTSSEL